MLRSRIDKNLLKEISMLTPWETQVDETSINNYCSDFVTKIDVFSQMRKENNLPKIHSKQRAISHCHTHTKVESVNEAQKVNENRKYYKSQIDNYQTFHTLSQNKTDKLQKKKLTNRVALQQLNVKNFIIQGGQAAKRPKEKQMKRRQCSYVMKQKFAQFRRSTKLIESNKQNAQVRMIRYQI